MPLTVGALARAAGVGIQTVRFYERGGLIEPPPRTPSGYRSYPDDVVARIRFIRRAQELGFTLKEIRELITLQTDKQADCESVRAAARDKVGAVENKINDLVGMQAALEDLIRTCRGSGPVVNCAIMESLSHDPKADA